MTTKELMILARSKGITIKEIAKATEINVSTLYHYNIGYSNISKEKEEKIRDLLLFLLDITN